MYPVFIARLEARESRAVDPDHRDRAFRLGRLIRKNLGADHGNDFGLRCIAATELSTSIPRQASSITIASTRGIFLLQYGSCELAAV